MQNNFISYIEGAFAGVSDTDTLYRYKRGVLEKMTARANEIAAAGLQNEAVLNDLIISEFPNLQEDYANYDRLERKRRRRKQMNTFLIFGSAALILTLVLAFLGIGFLTGAWSPAWLLVPVGILVWTAFLLGVFVCRITEKRRLFHPIARVLLALAVMCITVSVFLILLVAAAWQQAWVIFPAGVICMYIADGIYAFVTHQKLRIINYLLYIPAAAPMVYVILGGLSVIPWHPGWLIVPLSVLLDLILVLCKIAENSKYKYRPEVDAAWNEN